MKNKERGTGKRRVEGSGEGFKGTGKESSEEREEDWGILKKMVRRVARRETEKKES